MADNDDLKDWLAISATLIGGAIAPDYDYRWNKPEPVEDGDFKSITEGVFEDVRKELDRIPLILSHSIVGSAASLSLFEKHMKAITKPMSAFDEWSIAGEKDSKIYSYEKRSEKMSAKSNEVDEEKIGSIINFLKTNPDVAKGVIKKEIVTRPKDYQFSAIDQVPAAVKMKDGSYRSQVLSRIKDGGFGLIGFYIGKTGVIFTFAPNSSSHKDARQIEIKADKALRLLEGFYSTMLTLFIDKIAEFGQRFEELEARIAQREEEQKVDREAKRRAKYLNKPAFGSW